MRLYRSTIDNDLEGRSIAQVVCIRAILSAHTAAWGTGKEKRIRPFDTAFPFLRRLHPKAKADLFTAVRIKLCNEHMIRIAHKAGARVAQPLVRKANAGNSRAQIKRAAILPTGALTQAGKIKKHRSKILVGAKARFRALKAAHRFLSRFIFPCCEHILNFMHRLAVIIPCAAERIARRAGAACPQRFFIKLDLFAANAAKHLCSHISIADGQRLLLPAFIIRMCGFFIPKRQLTCTRVIFQAMLHLALFSSPIVSLFSIAYLRSRGKYVLCCYSRFSPITL